MRHALGVGIVLLLAVGLTSKPAAAQGTPPNGSRIQLKQNDPNPFNRETRIPFSLGDSLFRNGRTVKVTLKIYDQLHRYVATPIALNHPKGNAAVLDALEYTAAGDYEAFWNGFDRFHKRVASGLYFAQLVANGERSQPIRLIVRN